MSPDSDDGPDDPRPRSGISLQTLIVASLASAAASFAVARIWGPGTLLGAAAAPVIIALVSEALRRPIRTVTATAKKVPGVPALHVRGTSTPADPTPAAAHQIGTWHPRWWMAVVTGLVAFAIVLGVFTVPDLIAGSSITGNGQPTTFFGGSSKAKKTSRSTTTTATTTTRATTTTTTTATTTRTTATRTHAASTSPTTTLRTTATTAPTTSTAPPPVTPTAAQTVPAS